jgi:hypothetical protein
MTSNQEVKLSKSNFLCTKIIIMHMKNSKPLIEILNSYINNINIPKDRNIGTVISLLI